MFRVNENIYGIVAHISGCDKITFLGQKKEIAYLPSYLPNNAKSAFIFTAVLFHLMFLSTFTSVPPAQP